MSNKRIRPVNERELDEKKLWDLFLDGDLDAWEQIFTLYYSDLYGYGLALSTKAELTKDSIHELFVVLWDRRDHLSEVDSIKAYLLASLRRNLLKKISRRRKYYEEQENPSDYAPGVQSSPEMTIIEEEVKAAKIDALYRAMDELPGRQKEVLYLKYFNGMSYDEIEEILSIKYQSVKNHIHRAISNLKEKIDDDISKVAISLLPFLPFLNIW